MHTFKIFWLIVFSLNTLRITVSIGFLCTNRVSRHRARPSVPVLLYTPIKLISAGRSLLLNWFWAMECINLDDRRISAAWKNKCKKLFENFKQL